MARVSFLRSADAKKHLEVNDSVLDEVRRQIDVSTRCWIWDDVGAPVQSVLILDIWCTIGLQAKEDTT